MKFIIESEMRVGSRWVHYLLADLYGLGVSPEVDGRRVMLERKQTNRLFREYFNTGRIPKIHHMHVDDLFYNIFPIDYKVLTVVRNPRDRAVSVAFHHKNDPGKAQWPQRGMTDEEAVRYTVLEYDNYNIGNTRMFSNMKPLGSVGNYTNNSNHAWVAYEWLVDNPVGTFKLIDMFLQGEKVMSIEDAVNRHSFEKKAGRSVGDENRKDTWRRKGVNKDWENWFDDELKKDTQYFHDVYKYKLAYESDSTVVLLTNPY